MQENKLLNYVFDVFQPFGVFFKGIISPWRFLPHGEREKAAGNLNLCASR